MIAPHKVHSILKNKMGLILGRHYIRFNSPGCLALSAKFDEGDQIIIDTLKLNGVDATFDGSFVRVDLYQEAVTNDRTTNNRED